MKKSIQVGQKVRDIYTGAVGIVHQLTNEKTPSGEQVVLVDCNRRGYSNPYNWFSINELEAI